MTLNNIQLCRSAAFIEMLRLIVDRSEDLTETEFLALANKKLDNDTSLTVLQETTLARSNDYAIAYNVDFPDETPRSTGLEIAQYELGQNAKKALQSAGFVLPKRGRGRPRKDATTGVQAQEMAFTGDIACSMVGDNWMDTIDDSEAYKEGGKEMTSTQLTSN